MTESDGPIVAAVRRARAAIAAECGYDLQRLGERLRRIEASQGRRIRPRKTGPEARNPIELKHGEQGH